MNALRTGAKLYNESKQQAKRLKKVILGMSCLIIMLMAAMTGLVFTVVEMSKVGVKWWRKLNSHGV